MIDRVLVVDDELLTRQLLVEVLRRNHVEVDDASSGEEACEMLKKKDYQMAFCDMKMGGMNGLEVLRHVRDKYPEMLFVIVTAYGTIDQAVEAMQLGAFDFIIKPFSPDQTEIILVKGRQWLTMNAKQAFLQQELLQQELAADDVASASSRSRKMVGASPQMDELQRLIARVARTQATVLVNGESGTGKEMVAAEIHRLSDSTGKAPYIRMNCAAVPENLLESELFGHEKGAFTGATDRRIGRFEMADGGTILLDEISEISVNMQSKLLRVLQESEFERVGGTKTIKVNVRVIATTNRNLVEEVRQGNFREDLYYRINVFPIYLPPLRERGEDIARIARYFLKQQEKRLRTKLTFSPAALQIMQRYAWPGNIRELENVVERIAILNDGPVLESQHLPYDILHGVGAQLPTVPLESRLQPQAYVDSEQKSDHGQVAYGQALTPSSQGSPPLSSPSPMFPGTNSAVSHGVNTDGEESDIPPSALIPSDTFNLQEIEHRTIMQALEHTGGNRTKAATLLGFSVRTLRNKLNEYRDKGLITIDLD